MRLGARELGSLAATCRLLQYAMFDVEGSAQGIRKDKEIMSVLYGRPYMPDPVRIIVSGDQHFKQGAARLTDERVSASLDISSAKAGWALQASCRPAKP